MKEKINSDFMQAMKNKNSFKKSFLGILKGEIQNEELRTGKEADVDSILKRMEKSLKATNDSEAQLQLEILNDYLPKMMSKEEIQTIIEGYIDVATGNQISDIMKRFNSEYKGKADNKIVMEVIKELI